jgi:hypothetical protein
MKKLHIAPYCVALAIGNSFLPQLLGRVGQIMEWVYHRGSPEWERMAAGCTPIALALPPWFYVFTALSILACVGLFIRQLSASLLVHWLLGVCMLEYVALIFFVFGICISLAPIFDKVGG